MEASLGSGDGNEGRSKACIAVIPSVCVVSLLQYLDMLSLAEACSSSKALHRDGTLVAHCVWKHLIAANLSSPFITLPTVGGGVAGQRSFAIAAHDLIINKKSYEVLVSGGMVASGMSSTNEVFKMIFEWNDSSFCAACFKRGPPPLRCAQCKLAHYCTAACQSKHWKSMHKRDCKGKGGGGEREGGGGFSIRLATEESAPMLVARAYHGSIYHQGEVLHVGSDEVNGATRMERLDTLTHKKAELVDRIPNDLRGTQAVHFNNKLYSLGGFQHDPATLSSVPTDTTYELDEHPLHAEQGTWRESSARLVTARFDASPVVFQGKLHICCGFGAEHERLSSIEVYDPVANVWQLHSNTAAASGFIFAFVHEGALHVFDGDSGEDTGGATIERYNSLTNQWELESSLGHSRDYCAAVLVGSMFFVFGGGGFDSSQRHATSFDYYDLRLKKWASQDKECAYFERTKRILPRSVICATAVLIPPPQEKTWAGLNVVVAADKCEEEAQEGER